MHCPRPVVWGTTVCRTRVRAPKVRVRRPEAGRGGVMRCSDLCARQGRGRPLPVSPTPPGAILPRKPCPEPRMNRICLLLNHDFYVQQSLFCRSALPLPRSPINRFPLVSPRTAPAPLGGAGEEREARVGWGVIRRNSKFPGNQKLSVFCPSEKSALFHSPQALTGPRRSGQPSRAVVSPARISPASFSSPSRNSST